VAREGNRKNREPGRYDSLGPGNPSRELDSLQDCQPQDKRDQKRRMGINDRRRKTERET